MALSKSSLKMARRIWSIQKRHKKTKFQAKDFTKKGTLTKTGKEKTRR